MIGLVVLISTATTVLALALVVDSNAPFDHAFTAQRGADIVATIDPSRLTTARLTTTAKLPQVSAAAGPFAEATVTSKSGGITQPPVALVGRASAGGPVDDLVLNAGRWATRAGEVVLSSSGDSDLGLPVGAHLRVNDGTRRETLTVVGLANSVTDSAAGWVAPAEIADLRATGAPVAFQMLYRFAHADNGSALNADIAALKATLPAQALLGTQTYTAAKTQENSNIAPFVPFLLAFGILGIVMAVLIVANVVGGAVVAGYRRIGILKSLGFTPTQVAAAYALQVAVPALVGCALGTVLGNLLAVPLLRRNAEVYGVGSLGVPLWIDAVVPASVCGVAALAALLPALRAGRLDTVQAIASGRAPRTGRGYAAHRLLGRLPLPRPVSIGLAAPFARPTRTLLTLTAVLLGATAVTFAVGLTGSLQRVVAAISRAHAQPVQIEMPSGGPSSGRGPAVIQSGPLTGGPAQSGSTRAGSLPTAAVAERAIEQAVNSEPGTLHAVAEATVAVGVAGLSQQVPVTAFRGSASWAGYELVNGHWYSGAHQAVVPTGFLTTTGTAIGDTITITLGDRQAKVRIVGELFSTRDRGISMITGWSTLTQIDPGLTPDQYDIGLRPGTSPLTYVQAIASKLGPNYIVEPTNRKANVVDAMIGLIATLTLLLAIVAALGVLNTVVLNTRERIHDLGIFKAIGMTPQQTIAMAVSWVAGIGLAAGMIAIPLALALQNEVLRAMGASVGLRLPASIFNVYRGPELVGLALAGMLIAIAGALPPASWAAHTKTATALHTE